MGNLTHTVSGGIASFRSAARVPIESLKCHFLPVQEGTGDPSPDNVRSISGWDSITAYKAKKNIGHIFGYSSSTINSITSSRSLTGGYGNTINTIYYTSSDTAITITQTQWPNTTNKNSYKNGYFCVGLDNLIYDQSYDFSFKITNITNNPLDAALSDIRIQSPGSGTYYSTEIKDNILIFHNIPWRKHSDQTERCSFEIYNCGMSFTMSEFMVTPAETNDGVWEPYQGDIIPITFPIIGKNKFNWNVEFVNPDVTTSTSASKRIFQPYTYCIGGSYSNYFMPNAIENYNIENGIISVKRKSGYSVYGVSYALPLIEGQTYYLSCTAVSGFIHTAFYDKEGNYLTGSSNNYSNFSFTVPNNSTISVFNFIPSNTTDTATFSNIQIELGNAATEYTEFSGNNTVYGGYVDIAKGEIVATHERRAIKDFGENGSWWAYETYKNANAFRLKLPEGEVERGSNNSIWTRLKKGTTPIASIYKSHSPNSSWANYGTFDNYTVANYNPSDGNAIAIKDNDFNGDVSAFLASRGNETICYKLAEPIHYPLSKTELKTFLDQNNIWSNTNDITEVSYQIHDSNMIRLTKKQIIGNEPHIETTSGIIATFNTDIAAPLKECKIYFNPIQEGSGDPSPENVRNINGWNGLSINQTGKNLLDPVIAFTNQNGSDPTIHVNSNGSVTVTNRDTTSWTTRGYLDLPPGTYYFYSEFGSNYSSRYIINDVTSTETNFSGKKIITITEPTRFRFKAAMGTEYPVTGWIQIFATDDTYGEYPYINNTQNTTWTSNGTVYGGYINLISGNLYQEWRKIKLADMTWANFSGKIIYYTTIDSSHSREVQTYVYSDTLTPITDGKLASATVGGLLYYGIGTNYNNEYNRIWTKLPEAMESVDANTWIKETYPDATICYKLATPILVTTLTPQQLFILRGTNNIWSNTNGNIEVKYWTH